MISDCSLYFGLEKFSDIWFDDSEHAPEPLNDDAETFAGEFSIEDNHETIKHADWLN